MQGLSKRPARGIAAPRLHVALAVALTVTLARFLVLRSFSRILEEKGDFLQSTIIIARSIRLGVDPGISRWEIFP